VAHTQGGHRGQDIDNDYGRFGRMFPGDRGPIFDATLMGKLAKSMIKMDRGQDYNKPDGDENGPSADGRTGLPAAYTYFGQFVDHDITLDLTGLGEQEADTEAVENFRSARLDLDCVYGHGVGSSRFLYDTKNYTFQISTHSIAPGKTGPIQSRFDLFRAPTGTALIGDHRNDENTIVAQIQQAMTQFHNKVITDKTIIDPSVTGGERFRAAAQIVRHHYQWVVLKDYLKRICDPAVYAAMVPAQMGVRPTLKYYNDTGAKYAYMPIEFAGAAYRFGHSMVRPSYALNALVGTGPTTKSGRTRIPIFDMEQVKDSSGKLKDADDLRGFKPIRDGWGIDWGYFLELPATPPKAGMPGQGDLPFLWQPAYRIDTMLVDPLMELPEFKDVPQKELHSLAFRNLVRGSQLQLPAAQQIAARMVLPSGGIGAFPLMDEDNIWSFGSRFMDPSKLDKEERKAVEDKIKERKAIGKALKGQTPLWFYILREAEFYQTSDKKDVFGGRCLGPMGSILLLETFQALLWFDQSSVMHTAGWRPHPVIKGKGDVNDFQLKDLMTFALT
jgi:Animal haem peroxidase